MHRKRLMMDAWDRVNRVVSKHKIFGRDKSSLEDSKESDVRGLDIRAQKDRRSLSRSRGQGRG